VGLKNIVINPTYISQIIYSIVMYICGELDRNNMFKAMLDVGCGAEVVETKAELTVELLSGIFA
jgi:predicted TPR repeat methyltransferase